LVARHCVGIFEIWFHGHIKLYENKVRSTIYVGMSIEYYFFLMKLLLFIRFNHDFKCIVKFLLPRAVIFSGFFIADTRRSTAADIIVSS